jgi:hypothetical protein
MDLDGEPRNGALGPLGHIVHEGSPTPQCGGFPEAVWNTPKAGGLCPAVRRSSNSTALRESTIDDACLAVRRRCTTAAISLA